MKQMLVALVALGALAVIVIGFYFGNYNRLVSLNETLSGSWSEVENQMQRRGDLIPNLVNTVKGYAKHEKEVFENVAEARAKLAGAGSVNEKIKANQAMESALSRLLAIAEAYPQLKANENFIRLQDELAGTENRITVARKRYNETVQSYNIMVQRFPSNIVASMSGFKKKDVYFEAAPGSKEAPKVQF